MAKNTTNTASTEQRKAMQELARRVMAGKCGYHIEWYNGQNYIRPQAVIVPHSDDAPVVGYSLTQNGWEKI